MGNNEFAQYSSPNTTFVVQNISPQKKVIKIFNYPINFEATRDLLKIPGVSESDIRASLLKGELRHKLLAKDIYIVASDIDLLQFNTQEYLFLQAAGVDVGLKVTPGQASGFPAGGGGSGTLDYIYKSSISLIGTKNGTNRIFFTPDKFINGSYSGNIFRPEVYHNGRRLLLNVEYRVSLTGTGSGFNTITFISFIPNKNSQLTIDYYVSI